MSKRNSRKISAKSFTEELRMLIFLLRPTLNMNIMTLLGTTSTDDFGPMIVKMGHRRATLAAVGIFNVVAAANGETGRPDAGRHRLCRHLAGDAQADVKDARRCTTDHDMGAGDGLHPQTRRARTSRLAVADEA